MSTLTQYYIKTIYIKLYINAFKYAGGQKFHQKRTKFLNWWKSPQEC